MNICIKLSSPTIPLLSVILSVVMIAIPQAALAKEFTPPDLTGFNLHDERDADGDGDGTNETRIRQYLNDKGDSVVSFTSKGRVWAWSLSTRDSESSVRNYVIRDANCDGIFEEVYSLDEEFLVPECVK